MPTKPDDWRRFFELIQRPDWQDSRPDFEARYGSLRREDLYPDALRAIEGLKGRGYRVAVTANQPRDATTSWSRSASASRRWA